MRRLSRLDPEERDRLKGALFAALRLAREKARRSEDAWVRLDLDRAPFQIALRVVPGPFGNRTEAMLWGKRPPPTREDAEALAELLGLRGYVLDRLIFTWLIKEASYATGRARLAPATP